MRNSNESDRDDDDELLRDGIGFGAGRIGAAAARGVEYELLDDDDIEE